MQNVRNKRVVETSGPDCPAFQHLRGLAQQFGDGQVLGAGVLALLTLADVVLVG